LEGVLKKDLEFYIDSICYRGHNDSKSRYSNDYTVRFFFLSDSSILCDTKVTYNRMKFSNYINSWKVAFSFVGYNYINGRGYKRFLAYSISLIFSWWKKNKRKITFIHSYGYSLIYSHKKKNILYSPTWLHHFIIISWYSIIITFLYDQYLSCMEEWNKLSQTKLHIKAILWVQSFNITWHNNWYTHLIVILYVINS